jgi:hypothetical protein
MTGVSSPVDLSCRSTVIVVVVTCRSRKSADRSNSSSSLLGVGPTLSTRLSEEDFFSLPETSSIIVHGTLK